MKRVFIIFGLFIMAQLSSCGLPFGADFIKKKAGEVRSNNSTNPVFTSYIASFEQAARAETGNTQFTIGDVPINFGDTENPDFQGVCFTYENGQKEIIIRESWWSTAEDSYRESLLFHELGHCSLNREHDDSTFQVQSKSYKSSMMSSVIVAPRDYNAYKSAYWKELFTQSKSQLMQMLGIN